MNYNLDQIKAVLAKKSYKYFESGIYNLNIIGVRCQKNNPDAYDDEIYIIYRDENSHLNAHCFPCTTDPGLDYLKNPFSSKGTAILVPGQYHKMWQIRLHKGQYEALVQANPVKVYRDADKDNEFDFDPRTTEDGIFGINMHHANEFNPNTRVGKWSAGCQVFQNIKDFQFAMSLIKRSAEFYGNSFTYTLLEEKDFQL